jgi:PEGA domain
MGSGSRTLRSLLLVFLLVGVSALNLASQYSPTRIKVLSADFHSLDDANPVPKNCDLTNFDAYCNESKNATGENVMRVQDSDGKSFVITCTVDSRWSKCAPLQVGETYEARRGKNGITVWIQNPNGKDSTRQYRLAGDGSSVTADAAANSQPVVLPTQSGDPSNSRPLNVAPGQKAALAPTRTVSPSTATAAAPAAPTPAPSATESSSVPMASASAPTPAAPAVQESVASQVRCNFTTTPPGAEITLDGKYVGSTPSAISVGAGAHTVVFSMPGFAPWTRELTVAAGSDLTVNAILQKGKK